MRTLAKKAALLAVAISGFGCVSPREMRSQPPILTLASGKSAADFSGCAYTALVGINRDLEIRNTQDRGVHHITATLGYDQKQAVFDVAVEPLNAGSSVALRAYRNVWGGTNEDAEVHKILHRCAAK